MQDSLFDEPDAAPAGGPAAKAAKPRAAKVAAAEVSPEVRALANTLPATLRLGCSTWSYPGWAGIVWEKAYQESTLARHGLPAYAQHPLLRAISLDRSFYRPLDMLQYASYAAQVGDDFRFVVKAPSLVSDALVRSEDGRGMTSNPYFLNSEHMRRACVEPVLEGLQHKLGAIVLQISPLPLYWLERMPELVERLQRLLGALPTLRSTAPDAVVAVEVRDRHWLTPAFVQALKDNGATYCMGLHAKMPRIAEQLPILRQLWPGPLVCRWNLNPLHGAYGYEDAAQKYEPYDKLLDPDLETRSALARVISGVTSAGQLAYVTVSNKAEGSAPLSVIELAKAVVAINETK